MSDIAPGPISKLSFMREDLRDRGKHPKKAKPAPRSAPTVKIQPETGEPDEEPKHRLNVEG
jgi:hypothetical protein